MSDDEIDAILARTLEDDRLSRSERQSLQELAAPVDDATRDRWRHRAFQLAGTRLGSPNAPALLEWLEAVDRAFSPRPQQADAIESEAYFSPKDDCAGRIIRALDVIKGRADICVFTITDDRISEAILRAHRRGVVLRILSDDEKGEDLGSDIHRLGRAGIAVRTDRSEHHMHHKYMVMDQSRLLTGSYNWTRGASEYNQENILTTNDPKLVNLYARAFESLWGALGARP